MSEPFKPTTPPNTPERLKEADAWMARQGQALTDKLVLHLRDAAEEARIFREGIELIAGLFPPDESPEAAQ